MSLTVIQEDAVTELLNIAFSRTAAALSNLTGNRVDLDIPAVSLEPITRLSSSLQRFVRGDVASVHQIFTGPVAGDAFLLLNFDAATKLLDLLTGVEATERKLSTSDREALAEVGNILMNACLGVFGDLLRVRFTFSVPRISLEALDGMVNSVVVDKGQIHHALIVGANFRVRDSEVTGCLVLVLGVNSLDLFLTEIDAWATRMLSGSDDIPREPE